MAKPRREVERNLVAKNAHKYNRSSVQVDRKKALKSGQRMKHKGHKWPDLSQWGTLFQIRPFFSGFY